MIHVSKLSVMKCLSSDIYGVREDRRQNKYTFSSIPVDVTITTSKLRLY